MDFDLKSGGGEESWGMGQTKKGRIEAVMLSMVYTAITLTNLDEGLVYLLLSMDAFQLLHFSWKGEYMLGAAEGYFFSGIGGFTTDYAIFQILFYVAFIVVLLNIIMIATVATLMDKGQFRSVWPLKVFRLLTLLFKTVLLIPITNIFASAVHCNNGTQMLVIFPDQECYSGNLFPYVGSIIGLCLFIPYSLLSPIIVLDARPSPKKFLGTQAQGRTDAAYSFTRVALVFLHVFTTGSGLTYLVLICNCIAFGFLSYAFLLELPFYSLILNRIRVGFLVALVSSSFSSIIVYSLSVDETSALIVQIVTTAVGFGFGSYAPTVTYRHITQSVYVRIKEEIDLKSPPKGDDKDGAIKTAIPNRSLEVKNDDSNSFLTRSAEVDRITKTHTVDRPPIFARETDVEIACRFVRHNKDGIGLMHFIFRSGLQQYPKSVFLHATYAFYIQEYDPNREKQAQQLVRQCSQALQETFTERILLFFIQLSLESALRSNSADSDNEFSVSSFAEYQSLEASARLFHTQTLEELRGFWAYLASSTVSVRALPVFAQKIMVAEHQGDEYYKKLISRFPKSKVILRMYATWLKQVKNDPETANSYFEVANQIENNETYEGVKRLSEENLDDMDDPSHNGYSEDATDNGQKGPTDGPELSLMKDASRSLILDHGDLRSDFRLNTNSEFNLNGPSAISVTEHPSSIKQTAALHEEEFDEPPAISTTEHPDAIKEPAVLPEEKFDGSQTISTAGAGKQTVVLGGEKFDESQARIFTPEMPKPNDELKVRQGAFLEPYRRQSENRTVIMSDRASIQRGNNMGKFELERDEKDSKDEKGEYRKGPKSESNASSSASTKASRMKTVLKTQLEMRLSNGIRQFGKHIAGVNIVFLGLVIATYMVASSQFLSFNVQLSSIKISTRLGLRALLLSQLLREQLIAARENNAEEFEAAQTAYFSEIKLWKDEALPFLYKYYDNPYWIREYVTQYPNGTGQYNWLSEFGIGASIYQNGLQLLNMSMSDFADPSIETNNYFRYFGVPNMLTITDPIDKLSNVNQDAFVLACNEGMLQLYLLIGALIITVIGSGLTLFYPMVKKSGELQVKSMKFFTMISKKGCRHIYTNIEEDLENFVATGNDQQIQLANEAKLRVSSASATGDLESQSSNRRFSRIFALWLVAIFLSTLVVFIPPIVFEIDGVRVVKTIIASDSTRYDVAQVLRTSLELACHDDITFLDFLNTNGVVALLNDRIRNMVDYNNKVSSNHGTYGEVMDVTPLQGLDFIGDIGAPGMCLLLEDGACDPENRAYNASVGLTYEMATSGLDNILSSFAAAATQFAQTDVAYLDVHNRYYRFMRLILPDIRDGLSRIVVRLLEQQFEKSTLYKAIMDVLFPIALIIILCSYFAFRLVARRRISEMHQIVQLLFSVPSAIMDDTPQLSQFMQSGGMIGLEEN